MTDAVTIANKLMEAYRTGVPIAPVRGEIVGVSAAYAVQQASIAVWTKDGRRIAGRKIGLTSKAVQEQLGVNEPDFGVLFGDMIVATDSTVKHGTVLQPRIEAEIAFVMKKDVRGENITPEQVIEATDYLCPAIEICGSRIAEWNIKIEDTIADNASAGLVVVGPKYKKVELNDLPGVQMILHRNNERIGEGRGDACLGNPAVAVAWLAEVLSKYEDGLKAGDLVMSGALSKMVAASAGDKFSADFGPMGSVSVAFESATGH